MEANPALSKFSRMNSNTPGDMGSFEDSEDQANEEVRLEIIYSTKMAWLQEILDFWTKLIIILVTVLVTVISILVKADVIEIMIRSGVTILITGLLGWVINFLFGKFILDAKYEEIKAQMVDMSTVEIRA